MLTHYNVVSNIQQVSQVFMLDGRDKILGILPFFHSFGFMAALWLPAVNGVGVVYHPNPLDAQVIGELVERYQRDVHGGYADISAGLHAALPAGELLARCNMCWWAQRSCRSAWRWLLKILSAFVRWKDTAARSARR